VKAKPIRWRSFFVLWAASIIGIALVLPYAVALVPPKVISALPISAPVLVLLQLGQGAILFGVAVLAGLYLADRTGLGAPILEAWLDRQDVGKRIKSILLPSVLTGIVGTLLILALELLVFQPAMRAQNAAAASALNLWTSQPAAWKGLLASFYGGIDEELLLRLFALTLLAWFGLFIHRTSDGRPTILVLWIANILAAALFGMGHLPMTAVITQLTPLIVARALVLNGLLGVAFGYLYWTRGIESAMIAHFSADIVLHVAVAL
jgi:hypothetical protein